MNLNDFSPVLMAVVNAVLFALLPVLVVALIAALVGFTRKQWALFKASQPVLAEQLALYARIAVQASEQAGLAGLIDSKKQYALEITSRWLSQNGITGIDVELIKAEIERQVREMKTTDRFLNGPLATG